MNARGIELNLQKSVIVIKKPIPSMHARNYSNSYH
jgi:hypothetical protein